MKDMRIRRLKSLINNFAKSSILVVGDIMVDEFVWGTVARISPEAPVPVVRVNRDSMMPGGASNVAHNIRSLGGTVYLAGVIGRDRQGDALMEELKKKQIITSCIIRENARPTTVKTRVIAHSQQVVRIDREINNDISGDAVDRILAFSEGVIGDIDAIIIEDYGKGVIVPRLIKNLIKLANRHKKIVTVDPKEENFFLYKNVTAITPNRQEASQALGLRGKQDMPAARMGGMLLKKLNLEAVIITLGENGMCVCEKSGKATMIPTVAREVYDVCGAGDTVISAYTLALASGGQNIEAAHIANCAAGIVVGKVGIAVVTTSELIGKIEDEMMEKRAHGG